MSARAAVFLVMALAGVPIVDPTIAQVPAGWRAHVIDPRPAALELRVRDTNSDGAADVLVLFADGTLRIYRNPGPEKSAEPWTVVEPQTAAGATTLAFIDNETTGTRDFVTAATTSISLHLAGDGEQWHADPVPDAPPLEWTAVAAADLDKRHGIDVVAGSRYQRAKLGWFESLADPGESAGWRWHELTDAGWVSALRVEDMNGDGAADILYADRFGEYRGIYWLQNPLELNANWTRHLITARPQEMVFLALGDVDSDGFVDVLSAAKPDSVGLHRRRSASGREWQTYGVKLSVASGSVDSVRLGDVNRDGRPDLVVALEGAETGQNGIVWLTYRRSFAEDSWRQHEVSSTAGGSFHGLELLDLDGDGDLDILTSESRNLGVVWFENPSAGRDPAVKK